MRRVWQVERSDGEYADLGGSGMAGRVFAGGTMVVDEADKVEDILVAGVALSVNVKGA
jgi:hypothetical protein